VCRKGWLELYDCYTQSIFIYNHGKIRIHEENLINILLTSFSICKYHIRSFTRLTNPFYSSLRKDHFSTFLKRNNKKKKIGKRKRRKPLLHPNLSFLTCCSCLQFGLFLDRRVRSFAFPVLAFIFLYSKLPHKVL